MEIAPGTRLGPYEIVAPLGAGGMGEVYRARDTRLNRSVAVKILPAEYASNAQLRARFEQEAKSISQLNHPNICVLHDIGENYLVMELLEGESIADRLARGPIPIDQVMRIGAEIASALDRAHSAGIIHRDIKPGNVMLTRSGAKLLDFGLAKSATISLSPDDATVQRPFTEEGTIVGTFQYMSPEQLEGSALDHRSDIFSFGALLYEMATGVRAFGGSTKTSVIAAIVTGEPRKLSELQPLTPPAFEHIVEKCLAKDREDRWQSARDIAEELRWVASAGTRAAIAPHFASSDAATVVSEPAIAMRRTKKTWWTAAALLGWLVALGAVASAAVIARMYRTTPRVTRAEIVAPLTDFQEIQIGLSPNGQRLIAVGDADNHTVLWLRDLVTGEGRVLPGTDGATAPFWAANGASVGFFQDGKLKTINIEQNAVQTVCDATSGRGGTWNSAGTIVFAPNFATSLSKVSDTGGTTAPATKIGPNMTHRNPSFLPDGVHFFYSGGPLTGGGRVRVGSLDGSVDKELLTNASNAAFVAGSLLTVREHNLYAFPFDTSKLEITGKPVLIAEGVEYYAPRMRAVFSATDDVLVFHPAPLPKRQVMILDPSEAHAVAFGVPETIAIPAISPDGRRLIVNRLDARSQTGDLWMIDLVDKTTKRVTFSTDASLESTAAFSPDGQRVAIADFSAEGGTTSLYVEPVGGGAHENVPVQAHYVTVNQWAGPNELLITPQHDGSGLDVAAIPVGGDHTPRPLLQTNNAESLAQLSPDGKWLAYVSDETGPDEIFVSTYPPSAAKWQISTHGGEHPQWSGDGKQLYFMENGEVYAAAVRTGSSFSADPPHVVDALGDHVNDYAVARSGRIVALRETDSGNGPLKLVLNWRELLKAK